MPHSINHGDACFAYFNKIWGTPINLTDEAYGFVVTSVKETIALIDQSLPSLQRTSIAPP